VIKLRMRLFCIAHMNSGVLLVGGSGMKDFQLCIGFLSFLFYFPGQYLVRYFRNDIDMSGNIVVR